MNYKQLRIQFDEHALCVLDIETVSTEVMEDNSFPPWCTHKPVVASLLTADYDKHGEWIFALNTIRFHDVPAALSRIDQLLKGRSAISYHGRGFDFPCLLLAAQAMRMYGLRALTSAATEPRYWTARHYDLADKFSQFGSARGASLERLCMALGIPAKLAAHGSEVADLVQAGDIGVVADYCDQDVAGTLRAYAHWRAIETSNPGYYASLTFQFTRWVQQQDREHLKPFASIQQPEELLRLSLLGQLNAALSIAQLNADIRAKQAIDASFGPAVRY